MYNSKPPSPSDLPSSRKLIGSTFVAAVAAVVLLTTVVLPAEYGIDPTGVGRVLWLTEMGEIKMRLAAEAAADAKAATSANVAPTAQLPAANSPAIVPTATASVPAALEPATVKDAPVAAQWRDETSITLSPGQGAEIKLRMKVGEKAQYEWIVEGGNVNHDTHGEGLGRSVSYVKGRDVSGHQGELVAAFTGEHGWFWRNRGAAGVKLVLRTRGTYSDIQRIK